jgi:hypothetical protein
MAHPVLGKTTDQRAQPLHTNSQPFSEHVAHYITMHSVYHKCATISCFVFTLLICMFSEKRSQWAEFHPTAQPEICHHQPAHVEPREKRHHPPWRPTAFDDIFKVDIEPNLRVLFNKLEWPRSCFCCQLGVSRFGV